MVKRTDWKMQIDKRTVAVCARQKSRQLSGRVVTFLARRRGAWLNCAGPDCVRYARTSDS